MYGKVHYLRPLQHLHREVLDGARSAGEIVFPDGYVLPPDQPFTATPTEIMRVWNEFVKREHGGGLLKTHLGPVDTVPNTNEIVETGIIKLDTDHGPAIITVFRGPPIAPDEIQRIFDPIHTGGLRRKYVFGVEKLTKEIRGGGLTQNISYYRWKTPQLA